MLNFEFQCKTEMIFGKGTEQRVGTEVKKYSDSVLLVYGGGSIKKSGLYDTIISFLKKEEIRITELGGVEPNPRLSLVKKGIEILRKEKIGFILAVGGGSVIDTAKAMSAGFYYEGDPWDFYCKKSVPKKTLPIGTILTIAAAGSETSRSSVITNDELGLKKGLDCDLYRPKFSIMNPELTYSVPPFQTFSGAADMMSHIMERYFSNERGDVTDNLAEGLLKAIIKNALILTDDPKNYDARSQIMLAGSIAHNDLMGLGRIGDFATHRIEHELSAKYDVTHGAGIAVITLAWMQQVYKKKLDIFVQYAKNVWSVDPEGKTAEETAFAGIMSLKNFFKKIGLPVNLKGLNIPNDRFSELADECIALCGIQGKLVQFTREDIIQIYERAYSEE